MISPDPNILLAITRVQATCERIVQLQGDGTRHIVEFADGSAERLDEVLANGRAALTQLASIFAPAGEEAHDG